MHHKRMPATVWSARNRSLESSLENRSESAARRRRSAWIKAACWSYLILLFLVLSLPASAGQMQYLTAEAALPDAPEPQIPASTPAPPKPCPAKPKGSMAVPAGGVGEHLTPEPCTPRPTNWYRRFTKGPPEKALSPKDKGWLAARNLVDPFNLLTILGEGGISVAADPHSGYGPGMPGFGRYVGVSFTQDLTGEFFGTFLIPSVTHQDPHYHRLPHAKLPQRVGHALIQVLWTQGDEGNKMPNYANLAGFAIGDGISNLYVPDRETNFRASTERYGTGLATAPIGNFIAEFLPDVANHIHIQIVVIQRIINHVATTTTPVAQ